MIRIGVKETLTAAVLGAMLVPASLAQAQETRDDVHKVYRDMRTMSRVLSEVLDRHDLLDGPRGVIGASPFDTEVESTYLPTVGVLLNVSVNFPIEEPEDQPEEPAAPRFDPDEDLWERFTWRRGGSRDDDTRDDRGGRPGPPRGGDERFGPPSGLPPHDDPPRRGQESRFGREALDFLVRPENRFEAAKVEQLKNVILETLAEYGHRMDDLPDDERLLVIVDAPKTRGKSTRVGRSDPPGRLQLSGTVMSRQGGSDVTFIHPQGMAEPMVFGLNDIRNSPWSRDHWMISVQKSQLKEGVTAETLASSVSDLRY